MSQESNPPVGYVPDDVTWLAYKDGFKSNRSEAQLLEDKLITELPFEQEKQLRFRLLGYYFCQSMTEIRLANWVRQLTWLVQKCPSDKSLQLATVPDSISCSDFARIRECWIEKMAEHSQNSYCLGNAGVFISSRDVDLAIKCLISAKQLQPSNFNWDRKLLSLYLEEATTGFILRREHYALLAYEEGKSLLKKMNNSPKASRAEKLEFVLKLCDLALLRNDQVRAEKYCGQLERMELSDLVKHEIRLRLGRIALRRGDVRDAEKLLLKSAENGCPSDLTLPHELLLQASSFQVVDQFLEKCLRNTRFERKRQELTKWREIVRKHKIPDFKSS